jgi:hypothetical protein
VDHFTLREVIRLMVNLLFTPDIQILRTKGIVKALYGPAYGTGGMLRTRTGSESGCEHKISWSRSGGRNANYTKLWQGAFVCSASVQ